MSGERQEVPYDNVKRALDVLGASLAFVISLPVQGVVAILVVRNLGHPVLFKQKRPGRDGKIFTLFKFRSMREVDESLGNTADAQRLTSFGRALRSTSLDELPTLLNVIVGDMSIVGPRPLLTEYIGRYTSEQARRHDVRPGITGLAQINGRNSIDWDRKFALDVEYVENRSLCFDLRILVGTVRSVFARTGINAEGHDTMHQFLGGSKRKNDE